MARAYTKEFLIGVYLVSVQERLREHNYTDNETVVVLIKHFNWANRDWDTMGKTKFRTWYEVDATMVKEHKDVAEDVYEYVASLV